MLKPSKDSLTIFLFFMLSLLIRLFYGFHSWYIRDHARIFDLGFKLYKQGQLPLHGSPVILSNSVLPGSLQGIMAAIPLYFSHGHPFGIIAFVQILTLFSCLILASTYTKLFPQFNKKLIFALFLLNPMSIVSSFAWNPSFLLIFSTLFFVGLVKLFQSKQNKIAQFLVFFPHLLLLQLHLQFTILVALVLLLMAKKIIPIPNIFVFIASQIPGLVTLLPTIHEKIMHSPLTTSWSQNGNILNSIEFHPLNLFSYFHILARFISFSTGDVSHNLGTNFIFDHPWTWLFVACEYAGTAFIFCFSLSFFFSVPRWKLITLKESQLSLYNKLDIIVLSAPVISAVLFVFSIAEMSSHKIWCLFPFCFYPFFRSLSLLTSNKIKNKIVLTFFDKITHLKTNKIYLLTGLFLGSSLIYTCVGATYLTTNFSFIYHHAQEFCKVTPKKVLDDIILNESHAKKEEDYTASLLCQYMNH